MLIEEWMRKEKLTVDEFAKIVGCSRDIVYRWVGRRAMPGLRLALRIEDATRGEVTVEELRGGYVIRNKDAANRMERAQNV